MNKIYHRENYEIDKIYPLSCDYQVINLINTNADILEIGCATGYFGKYLSSRMNCRVTGIEISKDAAAKAKPYYEKLIQGNIEDDAVLKQIGEKYDAIMCIAVIEHLVEPLKTMIRLKNYLKKDGFFVITLPNIAHWSIRLQLLCGKFNYTEHGILDSTHLRFFTLKTAREMLEKAGLKIEHFSIDPDMGIPKFNELVRRIPVVGVRFLRSLYSLIPALFGYQFIFKAASPK